MTTEPTLMKNLWRHLVTIAALVACTLSSAGTITYYHNDIAGSPIAATNESGAVLWRESYRPYGERLTNAPASTPNDVWFTSRRQDVDTGLVYMGARYYDPVIGRFMSTDPVGFDENNIHSFNRYAYANNNPLKYKDPDGRWAVLVWAGAGYVAGVAADAVSQYAAFGSIDLGIAAKSDAALWGSMSGLLGGWSSGAGAGTTAAKSGVQILEREGDVVLASFKVANGEARVVTEIVRDGDRMILRGTHIEGDATLKEALAAGRAFGREQGAKEVVVEGGKRTTGANPGHVPRPITIQTGL